MTTKDKLAFALEMGRCTRADVRQVQALLRYASTLKLMWAAGMTEDTPKCGRVYDKVYLITRELEDAARALEPQYGDVARQRAMCTPMFDGPRLKIRVPAGVEVEVPA